MKRNSTHFQEIEQWYQGVQAPYGLQDIHTFNAIYRRAYSRLTREEKRRVEEEIVNAMIEGVEDQRLKAKIIGLV
jgi:hypothetical protein